MESSSNLLRSLQQLNDSAWANTLIPKLKENGSAGSFALACKQLRQLCHGTQHKLRLKGADCCDEAAIALIPQHFPSCSEVEFTVEDCEDSSIHLPSALPALARLQRLSTLELHLNDSKVARPYSVAAVLAPVRLLLPGLRCLQLSVNTSWRGSNLAWQALGRATQLTSLAVIFSSSRKLEDPVRLVHMTALSSLSSLASLKVEVGLSYSVQQYDFLQHLTGLTSLRLPLVEQHEGLSSIGSCTNLRELQLDVFAEPVVSEADCAALAHLVQLTSLDMRPTAAGSSPHFLSALGALSQLEYLDLDGLSPASLPCLAGLTKLTGLQGAWQAGGNSTSNTTQLLCSSVVDLGGEGPIPFAAFPQLKAVCQWDSLEPATLKALAENCKQLEELSVCAGFTAASLRSDFPVGERTAAIQALASLQHLTKLHFSVNDNKELAAVATIKQLKRLDIIVPAGSNCTAVGLQLLQQLWDLESLTMELCGLSLSQEDAQLLMCGMRCVRCLHIVASSQRLTVVRAALGAARAAQLAVPAQVNLHPLP